jgi:hypothetical protein
MPISLDLNEAFNDLTKTNPAKGLRRIDGIFFDGTGTPCCSVCISPVDNKPIALNKQFENSVNPDYRGGLFIYTCPKCRADYNISGNTLAMARANTPSP